MPDCVLSTQNRFYVEVEPSYGQVPTITAGERISAVKLRVRQDLETRGGGCGRLLGEGIG